MLISCSDNQSFHLNCYNSHIHISLHFRDPFYSPRSNVLNKRIPKGRKTVNSQARCGIPFSRIAVFLFQTSGIEWFLRFHWKQIERTTLIPSLSIYPSIHLSLSISISLLLFIPFHEARKSLCKFREKNGRIEEPRNPLGDSSSRHFCEN